MDKNLRNYWAILAFSGLLWVMAGAATGHQALPGTAAVYFEKAHRYHIIHTLAGMALCLAPLPGKVWTLRLWMTGIVLFCGSLYAMTFSPLPLRYVVPAGGVAFLGGWALMFAFALFAKK